VARRRRIVRAAGARAISLAPAAIRQAAAAHREIQLTVQSAVDGCWKRLPSAAVRTPRRTGLAAGVGGRCLTRRRKSATPPAALGGPTRKFPCCWALAASKKSGLRARPLDQYRVLYFATHGLLPGELHCQAQPGLSCRRPETAARTTEDDGLLEAGEMRPCGFNTGPCGAVGLQHAAAGRRALWRRRAEGLADAFFFNAGGPHAVLAEPLGGAFSRQPPH